MDGHVDRLINTQELWDAAYFLRHVGTLSWLPLV